MHHRLQKRAGRHHHCRRTIHRITSYPDPLDPTTRTNILLDHQPFNRLLPQHQVGLVLDAQLHRKLVGLLIGLGPGTVHGRALAAIEHAELQPGLVNHFAHQPAQGIDFPDDLPLGNPPDRRIAAHLSHRVAVHRQKRCPRADSSGRQSRLATGMAGTDDHHVEIVTRFGHHSTLGHSLTKTSSQLPRNGRLGTPRATRTTAPATRRVLRRASGPGESARRR